MGWGGRSRFWGGANKAGPVPVETRRDRMCVCGGSNCGDPKGTWDISGWGEALSGQKQVGCSSISPPMVFPPWDTLCALNDLCIRLMIPVNESSGYKCNWQALQDYLYCIYKFLWWLPHFLFICSDPYFGQSDGWLISLKANLRLMSTLLWHKDGLLAFSKGPIFMTLLPNFPQPLWICCNIVFNYSSIQVAFSPHNTHLAVQSKISWKWCRWVRELPVFYWPMEAPSGIVSLQLNSVLGNPT